MPELDIERRRLRRIHAKTDVTKLGDPNQPMTIPEVGDAIP
jgi:hypothetical protein